MKKTISNDEARTALAELEVVKNKSRHLVFADFTSFPLMLWGVIMCSCYLLGYFYTTSHFHLMGQHPDRVAGWLTLAGLCVTFVFIFLKLRYANPIRVSGTFFERYRAVLLVVVWFLFHFSTDHLHTFESGRAMNAFNLSYWMLLYIVLGFWLANRLFITVGTLVGLSAIVGYSFMGEYYSLWMAVMGGGTLFVGGLYPRIKYCRIKAKECEA